VIAWQLPAVVAVVSLSAACISHILNSLLDGRIDLKKLVDIVQISEETQEDPRIDDHDAAKPNRTVKLDEGVASGGSDHKGLRAFAA
jgi:hypothetical protein